MMDVDDSMAKIMGWEKRTAFFDICNTEFWYDGDERQIIANAWHPSTNIAQTWQVLKKIKKSWLFSRRQAFLKTLQCEISKEYLEYEVINWPDLIFFITPLAICKAALETHKAALETMEKP